MTAARLVAAAVGDGDAQAVCAGACSASSIPACCMLSRQHQDDRICRSVCLCDAVGTLLQGLDWCAAAATAAARPALAAAISVAAAAGQLQAGEHDAAAAVLQVQQPDVCWCS